MAGWAGIAAALRRWRAGTRAAAVAPPTRCFAQGTRPVLRWIKGDGLDDAVTRSAIAQATRLFGDSVDYCLCTAGLAAPRVRDVLAWATRPVEWWPLSPEDNPVLARLLADAGCAPARYGYWWKWVPERVRPDGPEWILDGDMVVTGRPAWFDAWRAGRDPLRVSQDDRWPPEGLYGEYVGAVDTTLRLYSGLVSLPPGLRYMEAVAAVLAERPLAPGHDGCTNMSEQGVIAAAFGALKARPIPLAEFPFARAFEDHIDYGLRGPGAPPWGYHFGFAFRRENPHFLRLAAEGAVTWRRDAPTDAERYAWLRNDGPWGREGWSMHPVCVDRIAALAKARPGPALEIGTSRGHLAAVLAAQGCHVTTIDREDRGAAGNLAGLPVTVVRDEAVAHLARDGASYGLIVVDLHGNGEAVWRALWPRLAPRLAPGGTLVLYNSHLWKIEEWREETGLRWLAANGLDGFATEIFEEPAPGMIVCRHG